MTALTGGVAVADGLLAEDELGPALVGSRCPGCGACAFPTALACRNPACAHTGIEPVRLGRTGTLWSWTVQHYQPPPLFAMQDWAPYALGAVEVPEGLRVMSMLVGCPPDELEIGMDLRLVTYRLRTDSQGREVLTYAYAPAGEQA